jgi:hypothetical protein
MDCIVFPSEANDTISSWISEFLNQWTINTDRSWKDTGQFIEGRSKCREIGSWCVPFVVSSLSFRFLKPKTALHRFGRCMTPSRTCLADRMHADGYVRTCRSLIVLYISFEPLDLLEIEHLRWAKSNYDKINCNSEDTYIWSCIVARTKEACMHAYGLPTRW